jgi:hypothetical protein
MYLFIWWLLAITASNEFSEQIQPRIFVSDELDIDTIYINFFQFARVEWFNENFQD